jgi:hypothetical protein
VRVWSIDFIQTHLVGFFFLEPEDVTILSLEVIWNFSEGTGKPWLGHQIRGHKACPKGLCALRLKGLETV